MPIQDFALNDTIGTRRLQVYQDAQGNNITILLESSAIGSIPTRKEFMAGREIPLKDGSVLRVQLVNFQVQAWRNGQPLPPMHPGSAPITSQSTPSQSNLSQSTPSQSTNLGNLYLILRSVRNGARKALDEDALTRTLSDCQETLKLIDAEGSSRAPVTTSRVVIAHCAALAARNARKYYSGDRASALDEAITAAEQRVQPDEAPVDSKKEMRNVQKAVTRAEKEAGLYASWVAFVGIVLGICSAFLCFFAFLFVRELIFGLPSPGTRVDLLGIAVLLISVGLAVGVARSMRAAYKQRAFRSAVLKNPRRVASACAALAAYCAVSVTSIEQKNFYQQLSEAVTEAACAIALMEPDHLCGLVSTFNTFFPTGAPGSDSISSNASTGNSADIRDRN